MRRPIESARTFPRRAFFSPEFYEFEVRHLLRTSWMAVAFSAEVADTGDVLPLSILGEPVLLARDGVTLRAFHNITPYGGCEVVIEPADGLDRIVTPYHGWESALDGRLLSAGYWDGTPGSDTLDPGSLGADLARVAVAEWFGVVFVRLAETGETFEQYLAPVLADIYQTQDGWGFLRDRPGHWQRILWRNPSMQTDGGLERRRALQQGRRRPLPAHSHPGR